jgi:hypothetical protein
MCVEAAMVCMEERGCRKDRESPKDKEFLKDRAREKGILGGEIQVRTATAVLTFCETIRYGAAREPSMCWGYSRMSQCGWPTMTLHVAPQKCTRT